MVRKKITLIGSSPESWEDATQVAIEEAMETLHDIEWIEVVEQTAHVGDSGVDLYHTEIEVAFTVKRQA
ncbi:MAG: Dodecin [Methanonatronarchaeales archaeon]|nr:Dodecin [Methanonatronarchaeales archaeon]